VNTPTDRPATLPPPDRPPPAEPTGREPTKRTRPTPSRRVPAGRTPARLSHVDRTCTTGSPSTRTRTSRPLLAAASAAAVLTATAALVVLAGPAWAAGPVAPSLNGVIDALRLWLVGILAALATLFLTVGGIRYLTAAGDPAQVERAKVALKSAAIGYALAAMAPLLVSILQSVVGA